MVDEMMKKKIIFFKDSAQVALSLASKTMTNNTKEIQEYVRKKCGCISPSLNSVLRQLEKEFRNEYHKMIFQDGKFFFICARDEAISFYWGFDQYFEGQPEKTQRRVAILLGYKGGSNEISP